MDLGPEYSLNIEYGGMKSKTSEQTTKSGSNIEGKLLTEVGIHKKLFGLAKAYGEISASAGMSRANEKTIETTISNTVLTDYLEYANDQKVSIIKDTRVYPYENSFTFMKLFAPYLKMINTEELPFNARELNEVLSDSKGYYELIGEKKNPALDKSDKSILRFNMKAFRNNYGLIDLPKMDLIFHAIYVGTADLDSLNPENEFNIINKAPSIDDFLDEYEVNTTSCKIYDVILAGVISRSSNE